VLAIDQLCGVEERLQLAQRGFSGGKRFLPVAIYLVRKGVRARVSAAGAALASPLVRPSDPGVVMPADERVEIMRRGFHRTFNPAVNNARSNKLEADMWAAAYRERRMRLTASSSAVRLR